MLRSQKEVVVFVEQGTVQSNESLPLIVVEFLIGGLKLRILSVVDLDVFALDHNEAGVYALDLGDKLLLGDGPSLRLLDEFGRLPALRCHTKAMVGCHINQPTALL
jgi:hypothetical protein